MLQRLDKIISSRTALSRREAISAIRRGEVEINNEVCRDNTAKADINMCDVRLKGVSLEKSEHIYIMQNKPLGVVSASEGERERNVIDILPPELYRKNLFPAGRLDKASTGFVLITDDGGFAHRLLSPVSHVEKEYIVEVDGRITGEVCERFRSGLVLKSGEKFKCAQITPLSVREDFSRASVILSEGKYHQIRRMFASSGLTVTSLHRIRIGRLKLDPDLPPGGSRRLSDEEVQNAQK